MAKQLSTSQLMVLERLLGKQCTLQGKTRTCTRTHEQNQRLGIPNEHNDALLDLRIKNIKNPKLRALLRAIANSNK